MTDNTANKALEAVLQRVERLNEEIAALTADKREVLAEAKGNGFDVPTIRELIRLRKMDPAALQEREHLLSTYKKALGMLAGTPLGDAAMRAA